MPTRTKRPDVPEPKPSRPRMPGYGLPRGAKGLLPWSWAKRRLEGSRQYWLATVRPSGAPHVMVVWGLWLDGAFYFSTGRRSRKARNLARNPRCVVCTAGADQAVVLEGTAAEVEDPERRRTFCSRYEKKYAWDMSDMDGEPVYVVRGRVAFGLRERDFTTSATRWQL
jgi:PPOX class probable F420-dependent enzyme